MTIDPSTTVQVITLTPDGQGEATVDLNGVLAHLITRWNGLASCWSLDISDSQGRSILAGLMLVPGVDILAAYQEEKATLGSIAVDEAYPGAYQDYAQLGTNVKLIWTPPGQAAMIP